MKIEHIKLDDIVLNEGQVEGLPINPRQWTKTELNKLKKSIQDTPELLEARGILVYPYDGKFVVLGGNMRLSALRELKAKDAPCIIVPEDMPIDKLRELVIKDNGAFGAWDFDELANEWGDLPLIDWGVPAWDTNDDDLPPVEIPEKEHEDKSGSVSSLYQIAIDCENEEEQERIYNELKDRYLCRILTL